MALVAEQEREAISQRTKAALAAAKARGTRLGKPKGTKVPTRDRLRSQCRDQLANAAPARRMRPVLTELNELSARCAAQEQSAAGMRLHGAASGRRPGGTHWARLGAAHEACSAPPARLTPLLAHSLMSDE